MPRCLRLVALGVALVMLGAASPPPPIIERAFGNTIVSTYPDNREARLWLDPSGSYAAIGPPGDRTRGQWRIKGGKLCLRQTHPPMLPFLRYCTPIPAEDPWTTRAITGETIRVRIAKDGGP